MELGQLSTTGLSAKVAQFSKPDEAKLSDGMTFIVTADADYVAMKEGGSTVVFPRKDAQKVIDMINKAIGK